MLDLLGDATATPERKLPYVESGATISKCGKYRYRLWREWRGTPNARWDWWTNDDGSPVVDGAGAQLGEPEVCVFVMLNPSTADGNQDDPTIRRCVAFAKSWGYERVEVVNLFAYRATDPRTLLGLGHNDDPVGVDNQSYIEQVIHDTHTTRVVCAWGAHGGHLGQNETMLGWIGTSKTGALGVTKEGHPRHPLYVKGDQPFVPFPTH